MKHSQIVVTREMANLSRAAATRKALSLMT